MHNETSSVLPLLSYYICFNTACPNSVQIYTNAHINVCTHARKTHAKRINGDF